MHFIAHDSPPTNRSHLPNSTPHSPGAGHRRASLRRCWLLHLQANRCQLRGARARHGRRAPGFVPRRMRAVAPSQEARSQTIDRRVGRLVLEGRGSTCDVSVDASRGSEPPRCLCLRTHSFNTSGSRRGCRSTPFHRPESRVSGKTLISARTASD